MERNLKKYSVAEAKARLSEILSKVEAGADVLITRRGEPVACVSGIERPHRPLRLAEIDAFRATLVPAAERGVELIRRMRDAAY